MAKPKAKPVAECEHCKFWNDPNRPKETFYSLFGLFVYDVEKAREMVKDGRKTYELQVEKLKHVLDYVGIRDEHVDHVPMDEPIIIAYTGKARTKEEQRLRQPIDGHHRLARAVKEGRETIKVYLLTEQETDKILTDRRPRVRKPGKPRKLK